MLKDGFLASTNFYACTEHTSEIIEKYFDKLDRVFKIISECENEKNSIDQLLEGPVSHAGFERLN